MRPETRLEGRHPKTASSKAKGSLSRTRSEGKGSQSDGREPSTNPKERQTSRHIGPTTRAMAKRLDKDWNTATDGRETYLYMFQEVQNQALHSL